MGAERQAGHRSRAVVTSERGGTLQTLALGSPDDRDKKEPPAGGRRWFYFVPCELRYILRRGSRASRSASPMKLIESTVSKIRKPGNSMRNHGCPPVGLRVVMNAAFSWPAWSRFYHEGTGSWMPRPRKERNDSVMMKSPTASGRRGHDDRASRVGHQVAHDDAAVARAERPRRLNEVEERSDRIEPRTRRLMPSHPNSDSTTMMVATVPASRPSVFS